MKDIVTQYRREEIVKPPVPEYVANLAMTSSENVFNESNVSITALDLKQEKYFKGPILDPTETEINRVDEIDIKENIIKLPSDYEMNNPKEDTACCNGNTIDMVTSEVQMESINNGPEIHNKKIVDKEAFKEKWLVRKAQNAGLKPKRNSVDDLCADIW